MLSSKYYTGSISDESIKALIKDEMSGVDFVREKTLLSSFMDTYPNFCSWDPNVVREVKARISDSLIPLGLQMTYKDGEDVIIKSTENTKYALVNKKMTTNSYGRGYVNSYPEDDDPEDEEEEEEEFLIDAEQLAIQVQAEIDTIDEDEYELVDQVIENINMDHYNCVDDDLCELELKITSLIKGNKDYCYFKFEKEYQVFPLKYLDESKKDILTQSDYNKFLALKNKKEKQTTMPTKKPVDCDDDSVLVNAAKKTLANAKRANKEAAKRNGVRLLGNAATKGTIAVVKASGLDNQTTKAILAVANTKAGPALGKGLVGFLVALFPQYEDDPLVQMLAEEAQNQMFEDGQQIFGELVSENVEPLIKDVLDKLRKDPNIQKLLKDRLADQ